MHPKENIIDFLKTYDKNNPIHLKTYEMFKESNEEINEIVLDLINSKINIENLQTLIDLESDDDKNCDNKNYDDKDYEDRFNKRIKIEEESFEIPGLNFDDHIDLNEERSDERNEKRSDERSEERNEKRSDERNEKRSDERNEEKNEESEDINANNNISNNNISNNISNNNITVFYQNILKIPPPKSNLNPSSPDYLFPVLQCKLCGLRFNDSSEIFTQHIEDHRRFTNALSEKNLLRREFFTPRIQNRIEKLDLTIEGEIETVIWEKESPICSICGKMIKKRWDDKIENWILENGVRINEKEVSHKKCVY